MNKNKKSDWFDHYTMRYVCTNCHESFIQEFKKGERAYQGTCPNCGVDPVIERRTYRVNPTHLM